MLCLILWVNRIHAISLGQGQGPVAEKLISNATANGDWVFLQVILVLVDELECVTNMSCIELSSGGLMDVEYGSSD